MLVLCIVMILIADDILAHQPGNTGTCPKDICICNATRKKVMCESHGKNLTFIPQIPRYMTLLQYNYNYLPYIHDITFKNLTFNVTNPMLRSLQLMYNQIKSISRNAFVRLVHLKRLDLSHNLITSFLFDVLTTSYLLLTNNSISVIPNFCDRQMIKAPYLSTLFLDNNLISDITTLTFMCSNHLSNLHLDQNPIKVLKNNAFAYIPRLKGLSLSNIGSRLQQIEPYAFNSSSLRKLIFSGNKHALQENNFDRKNIFQFLPSLTDLVLTNTVLPLRSNMLQDMFRPLKKVKNLILQGVDWRVLPSGIFYLMPALEKLVLSGNMFSSWNGSDVFNNVTSLRYLYLSSNNINLINETSFPPFLLQNLKRLDLSNNPFSCTCDLNWFKIWIENTNISLRPYPEHYKCHTPPELKFKRLKDFNITKESCQQRKQDTQVLLASIVSSCLVFVITIVSVAVYKCRWHIRYGIYLLRSKKRYKNKYSSSEESFIYDGFVIYSDEDRNWVHKELLPYLEDNHGLRLCIHFRDFEVGRLIVDNIVESIYMSRKVICILSNNFVKSHWCQFELLLAHDKLLKEGSEMMIIIMLTEINSRNMNSSMRALISSTTYASWCNDETAKHIFWRQITNAMERQIPSSS